MSKDRARRREAREREAAIRRAARAAQTERRERRAARRRAVRAATTGRFADRSAGRPTGVLATRRRRQDTALATVVVLVNVVVWVLRPDWPARLGAVVVSLLVFPVLRLLLFSRR